MPRWAYTNNSNFIQSVVFRIQRNKFTDKDKGNKILSKTSIQETSVQSE